MLRPADVTWSKVPVIVTFGAGGPAGACAKTGGASIARMTKAKTAVTRHLLITASSNGVSSNQPVAPKLNADITNHCCHESLEGQSDTRRYLIAIVGLAPHSDTVQHLGRVQGISREQVGPGEIEGGVRSEPPCDPEVHFRTQITGLTLHPAGPVPADQRRARDVSGTAVRGGAGRGYAGIGVHLFGGPPRVDDSVHAEGRRDAIGGSRGEGRETEAVVGDPSGHWQEPTVEIVDASRKDLSPAGEVASVRVEWLVVPDAPRQVVAGLVARAVGASSFEEERTELVASDDVH